MKKIYSLFLSILLFASCAEKGPQTVSGIICDASMNTLSIATEVGDTLSFSTTDAERVTIDGILLGDLAQVTYSGDLKKGNDITIASKVVVTPAILFGKWVQPIEGQDSIQGFDLKRDGVAESINMNTLVFKSWSIAQGKLILVGQSIGNGQTIDFSNDFNVDTLTAAKLVISLPNEGQQSYTKQQ